MKILGGIMRDITEMSKWGNCNKCLFYSPLLEFKPACDFKY